MGGSVLINFKHLITAISRILCYKLHPLSVGLQFRCDQSEVRDCTTLIHRLGSCLQDESNKGFAIMISGIPHTLHLLFFNSLACRRSDHCATSFLEPRVSRLMGRPTFCFSKHSLPSCKFLWLG